MRILITGAAGFLGLNMVKMLRKLDVEFLLFGIDNLSRKGSERNIPVLEKLNCVFYKGNIADNAAIDAIPAIDYIIDCAANPSVLAGVNGSSSMDLINDNLTGTFYLLEKCKRDNAGFLLISTSRVYSIESLNKIPLSTINHAFSIDTNKTELFPAGLSEQGITESFSTQSPISLYGATKLSSEILALEYHHSFGFPVWINRCGVIAGAGQFGKIDQGIFSYWAYQYALDRPLSFIGYGGKGLQSRDVIHPADVFELVKKQIFNPRSNAPRVVNIGGGTANTWSLFQLDSFCQQFFTKTAPVQMIAENRAFDIPLYVTDYNLVKEVWKWQPTISIENIMEEIISFAKNNENFLKAIA